MRADAGQNEHADHRHRFVAMVDNAQACQERSIGGYGFAKVCSLTSNSLAERGILKCRDSFILRVMRTTRNKDVV